MWSFLFLRWNDDGVLHDVEAAIGSLNYSHNTDAPILCPVRFE
jgi:hypothetical protein